MPPEVTRTAPPDTGLRPFVSPAPTEGPSIRMAAAITPQKKKRVAVCDTQPMTAEGIKTVLTPCADLEYADYAESLSAAAQLIGRTAPDIVLVDKGFGIQAVIEWVGEIHAQYP